MGNSFLIHTNVGYAPPMPNIYGGDSDLEKQLQKNLIGALAAEQKFYDMLGCANIMDFMRKYNEMMSSLNKDARVLKQLSSVNIRERILNKYQRGGATGAQDEVIVLTATGAHVDAITQALRSIKINQKVGDLIITGSVDGEVPLTLKPNIQSLKAIANALSKVSSQKTSKYKTSSSSARNRAQIEDTITSALAELNTDDSFVDVAIGRSGNLEQTARSIVEAEENFNPYNITPAEFKAKLNNPATHDEAIRIVRMIMDDLRSIYSQGSPMLQLIAQRMIRDQVDIIDLFCRTGRLEQSISGGFGEFQAALILEYVKNFFPNAKSLPSQMVKFVGNQLTASGARAPVDLLLFEMFGVQVKNFEFMSSITTSMPLMDVPVVGANRLLQEYIATGSVLSDAPIDVGALTSMIEQNASAFMPLAMSPQLELGQITKNSFFMFNGNIVPASQIIIGIQTGITEAKASLAGLRHGGISTEEFMEVVHGAPVGAGGGLFAESMGYTLRTRSYPRTGDWVGTAQNIAEAQAILNAITVKITIQIRQFIQGSF